jgi:hypothetical protein
MAMKATAEPMTMFADLTVSLEKGFFIVNVLGLGF